MAAGALEPQFYAKFLEKLNLNENKIPHLENFEENRKKIATVFKTKTQAEWCKIFDGSDACVTPVLTFDQVATHVHNSSRNSFGIGKDNLVVPNPAPRLSETPGVSSAIQSPNIYPGEHSIEILKELKYSSEEIKDFIKEGVIEQTKNTSKL